MATELVKSWDGGGFPTVHKIALRLQPISLVSLQLLKLRPRRDTRREYAVDGDSGDPYCRRRVEDARIDLPVHYGSPRRSLRESEEAQGLQCGLRLSRTVSACLSLTLVFLLLLLLFLLRFLLCLLSFLAFSLLLLSLICLLELSFLSIVFRSHEYHQS